MIKIVKHPETGNLFTASKTKEGWYKCQIESKELYVSNGIVGVQKRVAFPALNADTVELLNSMGLKDGSVFPLPGRIARKLTSTPQYEGHKPVINPSTGEELGYYQSFTFSSNVAEPDVDERVATTVTATAEAIPANSAIA